MDTVSRAKLKQRGLKRFGKSFKYALDGLKYAFKYEQSYFGDYWGNCYGHNISY